MTIHHQREQKIKIYNDASLWVFKTKFSFFKIDYNGIEKMLIPLN